MKKNSLITIISCFMLAAALVLGVFLDDTWSSKVYDWITIATAVIGAIALFIQFKKDKIINESSFLMDFSASFYDSYDCADLVKLLDDYDTEHKQFSYEENTAVIVRYMQWVESIGNIIDSGAISLKAIDQVLGYRFFIIVNNKIIQENELIPYRFYYMGTFELYERWYKYKKDHGLPVPMEENSLHLLDCFEEVREAERNTERTFKRRIKIKKTRK